MDSAEFSLVQLTSAQFSSVQLSSAQFSSGLDWSVLVWSGLVWRGSVLNSLEQLEQFGTIRPISRTGWMWLEIVPVSEFLFLSRIISLPIEESLHWTIEHSGWLVAKSTRIRIYPVFFFFFKLTGVFKLSLISLHTFLAVQDSSIGDLVTHSLTHSVSYLLT